MIVYNVKGLSEKAKRKALIILEKRYNQKYNWNLSNGEVEEAWYIGSSGGYILTAASDNGLQNCLGRNINIKEWDVDNFLLGEL